MLMLSSPLIVLLDIDGCLRVIIIESVAQMFGHILQHYSPAPKKKSVRYKDNITAFRNLICPGYALVIFVLMSLNYRVLVVASPGDLGIAKIFISAMIVKRKNTRKFTRGLQRSKNECFGRSSVRQLP